MQQLASSQRSRVTAPILLALQDREARQWTVQLVAESSDGYSGDTEILLPGEASGQRFVG